jgi:hypothetical protein
MFNEVKNLLSSQDIEMHELGATSSYLLDRQFIFRANSRDKRHYALIENHLPLFENGFEFFNLELIINHDYGFIGYTTKANTLSKISIGQSAILLVLRLIYHQERQVGRTEDGSVTITGSHFTTQYKSLTGRTDVEENISKFKTIINPAKEKSIIRLSSDFDEETGLPDITILPTIEVVVDKDFAEAVIKELASSQDKETKEADDEIV